jgi:hypothetical protein
MHASVCNSSRVSRERFSTQKSMRHLSFVEPSGASAGAAGRHCESAVAAGFHPTIHRHAISRVAWGSLAFALVCKAQPGTQCGSPLSVMVNALHCTAATSSQSGSVQTYQYMRLSSPKHVAARQSSKTSFVKERGATSRRYVCAKVLASSSV